MTFMDTTDGLFMNLAYGWAFLNPVRKVYYNLMITGLSIGICVFIGGIEVLGLLASELHLSGGFWDAMSAFDINKAGFFIVGLFVTVPVTFAAITIAYKELVGFDQRTLDAL